MNTLEVNTSFSYWKIGNTLKTLENCYGAVSPRLIFSRQCMLPAAKKNVQPANRRSIVIYDYVCDCRWVGRTTQRLQERIKQRVSKSIRQKATSLQEQGTH